MVKTLHNSKKSSNFDQLPWKGTLRSYVLSPYEARLLLSHKGTIITHYSRSAWSSRPLSLFEAKSQLASPCANYKNFAEIILLMRA